MDLSISIVSFNTREILLRCIQSVYDHCSSISFEILVVDNASQDGSAKALQTKFPKVRLIQNPTNRYFSAAHNQSFAHAQGEFFLLLNSDLEIKDKVLEKMVSFLREHPKAGGIGSQMYHHDGRLQNNCSRDYPLTLAFLNFTFLGKVFRKTAEALNHSVFYSDWDRQTSKEVEVIPDSLLMVRKNAIPEALALYDEQLSLYFTENDLCLRLRQKGFQMWYLADGKSIHLECQSVNTVAPKIISRIYRRDIFAYFRKHEGWLKAMILAGAIELTRILIRLLQGLRLYRFKKNLVWGT